MNRPLIFLIIIILLGFIYLLYTTQQQGPVPSPTANHQQPTLHSPSIAPDKPSEAMINPAPAVDPDIQDITPETSTPDPKTVTPRVTFPAELSDMLASYFTAQRQGNYEFAALVALDAIEISDDYPKLKVVLHAGAGQSYEKLGFIEMAIEQYQLALSINPEHRLSYISMRRLDPAFAASHPELPKPQNKKPATTPRPAITTTSP